MLKTTVGLVATDPATKESIERSPNAGVIMRGALKVEAHEKDGTLVGSYCKDDLTTKQLAQLIQLGVLASAQTITDTSGSAHSETTAATTGSSPTIVAGTSGTAPAFTDHALGTQTDSIAANVNAISSDMFTVTGTITNNSGSTRTYQEVGIVVTVNTHIYLICHDLAGPYTVSNLGTLQVTYTFTFT